MTIIAGFQCSDGILMCSDTEESVSEDSKSQMRKVPFFRLSGMSVAIGGAGDGALIEYIIQDLVKQLSTRPFDWTTAEKWFDNYARTIFNRHMRPYTGLPRELFPDVSFLIAVVMDGESRLFKWERNFAYVVPPMKHESIGIGTIQSQELLSEIKFSLPFSRMLLFAVRVMQKVKQLVRGCGGKTEVSFMDCSGDWILELGVFAVDDMEHMVAMIDEFITNYALTFIANPEALSETSIDSALAAQRKAILTLRNMWIKLLPQQPERSKQ